MRTWVIASLAALVVVVTLVLADPVGPFVGKEFRAYPGGDDATAVSGLAKPANTGILCDNDGNCVVAINTSTNNDGIINFNAGDALITWDDSQSLWVFDATATRFVVDNTNSLTVLNGTASGGASASGADGIVLDSNLATGISILTPTNIDGKISFNNDDCSMQWDDSASQALLKCTSIRVVSASLSGTTPNAAGDELVIDTDGNSGMSVLSPTANTAAYYLKQTTGAKEGYIRLQDTDSTLEIKAPATEAIEFFTGSRGALTMTLLSTGAGSSIDSVLALNGSTTFNAAFTATAGGTFSGSEYGFSATVWKLLNATSQQCIDSDTSTTLFRFYDCAGATSPDVTFGRTAANELSLGSGDSLKVPGTVTIGPGTASDFTAIVLNDDDTDATIGWQEAGDTIKITSPAWGWTTAAATCSWTQDCTSGAVFTNLPFLVADDADQFGIAYTPGLTAVFTIDVDDGGPINFASSTADMIRITTTGGIQVGTNGSGPITESHCGNVSIDPPSIAATTSGDATGAVTNLSANAACTCAPRVDFDDDLILKYCRGTGTGGAELSLRLYNPTGGAIDAGAQTVDYCCFEK